MSSSLTALLKKSHLSSPEEFLQAAESAIKENKTDIKAQQVRLVALLQLERYDDALKAFESAGEKLRQAAPLEHAYTLYKCNKLEEAQNIADSQSSKDRGLSHLAAQIAYRLEDFDQASALYKQLAASDADEDFDLRIQRSAVDAQLEWSGSGDRAENKKPSREDLDAFESAYNAACGCIARGELSQADILLTRAKQLCNASPDLSEEGKASELIPIAIQSSYVKLALSRKEDAVKALEDIDLNGISDLSLRHIGRVNSLVATPQTNPFYVHRLFNSTPEIPPKDAPFQFQQTTLRQSRYALDLQSSKFAGTSASTSAVVTTKEHPSDSAYVNVLSVINAAAKAHNQEGSQAIKAIIPIQEKRPTDIGLLLVLVQLYSLKNNHGSAITLVEAFFKSLDASSNSSAKSIRFAPSLVSVAVALYNSQGRASSSRALLSAAASYWRESSKTTKTPPNAALLRAAGSALLLSGDEEDATAAAEIFADLHARNPSDKAAIAGLVAATCRTNPEQLDKTLLKSLTPASRLTATIDAAALEAAGVARPPEPSLSSSSSKKRAAAANVAAATTTTAQQPGHKKRKLPKSRTPKDFVPGKQPDPERWLPLRDRSSWRPKGRKGRAKAAGLTQGGAVVDDGAAAATADAGKVVVGSSAGGGGGQARKSNNKKKGKGGKR